MGTTGGEDDRHAMEMIKKNGISWFLERGELTALIEGLKPGTQTRRTHQGIGLGGRQVFVKHFVEKGLLGLMRNLVSPRGKKEYDLGKRLAASHIATPAPLGYGLEKGGSFILQEYIDAVPFKAAFEAGVGRQKLLDNLAFLLKQLREQRVRHNDLHLENVMVSGERLYLIDLHKSVIKKKSLTITDELANLTHALTMIYDKLTEDEKSRFFGLYERPDLRKPTEVRLVSLWREWIESKKRRCFSTTSKLVAKEGKVHIRESLGLGEGSFKGFLKNGRKATVEAHEDHIRKVYRDKRRLVRAWTAHVILEYLEMPVGPRPYYIRKATPFSKGYIAMEDLRSRGAELDRFLDSEYDTMNADRRRTLARQLSQFLGELLRKGILHKDLKACNLFVVSDGFRLIDIEDVRFVRPGSDDLRKMFVQLNTSIPARIGVRDRIRFFAMVTGNLPVDKKRLFNSVNQDSLGREIVYEGVAGLKKESWEEHR
jgi:tRNA A-37 threonylcarbamoyl transferase component Bud32